MRIFRKSFEGFDDEAQSKKKKEEIEAEEILEGFDEDTAAAEGLVSEQHTCRLSEP